MQARFQRRILSRWETFETYVSVESELKWSEDADVFCWFCLDVLCKLCTCLDAEFVLPTCSLCEGASQTRGGWGALASGWAELSWRLISWADFVMSSTLSSTLSSGGNSQERRSFLSTFRGLAWPGMAWHGLAWPGMAWHSALFCAVRCALRIFGWSLPCQVWAQSVRVIRDPNWDDSGWKGVTALIGSLYIGSSFFKETACRPAVAKKGWNSRSQEVHTYSKWQKNFRFC